MHKVVIMPPSLPNALVVDDEIAVLSMFELLGRGLFQMHTVRDVERATRVRGQHTVALAIIDHQLTGEATGLALFEEMTCKKILMSADQAMADWATQRGGQWLRKPLDFLATQKLLRSLAASLG